VGRPPGRDVRDRLPEPVVAYLDGAAGDGGTLRDNESAWSDWLLRPRVLRDVTGLDPRATVLGVELAAPVFVAPWAGHGLVHPDAELATAAGSRRAGIGLSVSSGAGRTLADIAAVAGPFLQQVYLPQDRSLVRPLLEAAVAAGAAALLLTVDAPAIGNELGFRAGLAGLAGLAGAAGVAGRLPSPVNLPGVDPRRLGTATDLGPADIAWLTEVTGLPVLAKGVVRADDARTAVDAGAAGVVVSNHSGRQLGGGVPTAVALPEVVAEIGNAATVLVDGGIRSGEDVVRALALGADAVLVGRPFVWALAEDGADGVARLAARLVAETRTALAMCGAAGPADLAADLVRHRSEPIARRSTRTDPTRQEHR
jgi:4-hydroxymandelate oxidase